MDIISNMPDSILGKILSYLPSILSTKWKNIFPFGVPVKLVLNDYNSNIPSISFMEFVDRLFNTTLSDVPCVDFMVLTCKNDYGDAKIASWIRAAILLNIRKLILKFYLKDSKILYHSLNGCTTLSHLVLSGRDIGTTWRVPDNFRLPNLKILGLDRVTCDDVRDDLTESDFFLVDACPALEGLLLRNSVLEFKTLFCIRSPLMKILSIEHCFICSLIIDCPNLESFSCTGSVARGNYSSKFKSLLKVCLHTQGPWFDDVAKLITACSNTIDLYLSRNSLFAFHYSSVPLPAFQNLRVLWIGSLGNHGWALLARLLSNIPKLVQLTIKEEHKGNKNKGRYASFQKSLSSPPVCLEFRMKYFEFWTFSGDEDEIKLVEYFLKNGQVLREVTIRGLPRDVTNTLERLLLLPRHSKTCQIVIKQTKE